MIKKINLEKLTQSEKEIYGFLKDNFFDIPILKIEDILSSTYTSSSSLIRLSKKLGFSGWKDLKKDSIKKLIKLNLMLMIPEFYKLPSIL